MANSQEVPSQAVISVAITGDADARTLRVLTDEVRDDLVALAPITRADIEGSPPYEFSIEVKEDVLRRYRLTFSQVADAVRSYSVNLPAGSVKTEGGEILFGRNLDFPGRNVLHRATVVLVVAIDGKTRDVLFANSRD